MGKGVAILSVFGACMSGEPPPRFTTHCYHQIKTSMEKDKVVNEEVHRIRITLTSTNVKAVEKGICWLRQSLML